jgi:hypothetical protein
MTNLGLYLHEPSNGKIVKLTSSVRAKIMHHLSNSFATPVKPLYDTWKWQQDIGAWLVSLPDNLHAYSLKQRNQLFAEQLHGSLASFAQWQRVRKVKIYGNYPDTRSGGFKEELEWAAKISNKDFMDSVLQRSQDCPALISQIEVEVDVLVYTRTPQYPNQPVRAWIRDCASFRISNSGSQGYVSFEVFVTLFCRHSPFLDDNEELYNLNQPILSESLKAWEQQFGEINADDGLYGMYPHGFLPWPADLC